MVQANNAGVGEGDEVDSDSDYEEKPTTSPTNLQTGGLAQGGGVPGHRLLPGAVTT